MAAVQLTEPESAVWREFMKGGYQAFGVCQNPCCESPGSVVMTVGRSPSSRVCVICFEFDFECLFPSKRKLDGMRKGS